MTRYAPADTAFKTSLGLPERAFPAMGAGYLEEPRGRHFGRAGLLIAPGSTQEVAVVMRAANAARVAVVPYSGGTGLVSGQVAPDLDCPVILSLDRMRAIRGVFGTENVMVVEAGTILADAQAAADAANRLFPLSLASEGSARIGGVLSTNAGGVNVLRYGNARDLCLGVEAVLPGGQVMNTLTRLRKDNTGYDLRNLLIGAEGTLGIITAAALRLFPRPAHRGVALMVVRDPAAALDLLSLAGQVAGGTISAFELIYRSGYDFLHETMPDVRLPFENTPEWSVLIDMAGPEGFEPEAALMALFERGAEAGLVLDGLFAHSEAQARDFWTVRENIAEANRRIGAVASHDISVPLSALPEFIARGTAAIKAMGDFRINCFGHVGDGNLHFNAFPARGRHRSDYDHLRHDVTRAMHDLVHEMGGSFSAEHGVGRIKVADLERYGDPAKLTAMRAIKAALDPNGICNPGAVLRQ